MSQNLLFTNNAELRFELVGALVGVARAFNGKGSILDTLTAHTILAGLAAVADDSLGADALRAQIEHMHQEKERLSPGCSICAAPCGKTSDYDARLLLDAPDTIRSLKSLLLLSSCRISTSLLSIPHPENTLLFLLCTALFALGEDWTSEELTPILLDLGKYLTGGR